MKEWCLSPCITFLFNKTFIWRHNPLALRWILHKRVWLSNHTGWIWAKIRHMPLQIPKSLFSRHNWSIRFHDRPRLAVFKVKKWYFQPYKSPHWRGKVKFFVFKSGEVWVSFQLYMAVNHVSTIIRGNLLFFLEKGCVCVWQ